MIRHIALFKLHPTVNWEEPRTKLAVEYANRVGHEVPELMSWYAGRNFSDRPVAYDFVVMGTVRDQHDLDRYLVHPFHQKAVEHWREISEWVIADLVEEDAVMVVREVESQEAGR
jgi:hypothetical protein